MTVKNKFQLKMLLSLTRLLNLTALQLMSYEYTRNNSDYIVMG